ncbi:hypothetical protein E4U54_008642, partial [Claviceps lovelessii]
MGLVYAGLAQRALKSDEASSVIATSLREINIILASTAGPAPLEKDKDLSSLP